MYEMKLKVWDKKLQKMQEPIEMKKLLHYLWFQPTPNATAYTEIKDHFSDVVWLKNTSLKDKNDQEIYDGDIVKITGEQFESIFYVSWGSYADGEYVDDIQCWMVIGMIDVVVKGKTTKHKRSFSISDVINDKGCNTVEVIGNIFENVQLLPLAIQTDCILQRDTL
jgi:uncharacterized phage protein (TIGR01671 family)